MLKTKEHKRYLNKVEQAYLKYKSTCYPWQLIMGPGPLIYLFYTFTCILYLNKTFHWLVTKCATNKPLIVIWRNSDPNIIHTGCSGFGRRGTRSGSCVCNVQKSSPLDIPLAGLSQTASPNVQG